MLDWFTPYLRLKLAWVDSLSLISVGWVIFRDLISCNLEGFFGCYMVGSSQTAIIKGIMSSINGLLKSDVMSLSGGFGFTKHSNVEHDSIRVSFRP